MAIADQYVLATTAGFTDAATVSGGDLRALLLIAQETVLGYDGDDLDALDMTAEQAEHLGRVAIALYYATLDHERSQA